MRVERPAASTTAAMFDLAGPFSGAGSARGCGRVTISISRPPTPMPVMSARLTGRPASIRISTQSKPFSFGERAQPGAPTTACPPRRPISIRLPGSTGMPKCSISPPTASIAAGMTSRRSAMAEAPNTMISSAPLLRTSVDGAGERRLLVRHALLGDDAGAGRRDARGGDLQRLVDHLRRQTRQQRRDDADLLDRIRRDADDRLGARRFGHRLVARGGGDGEGDDLHRRDHLAFHHRLERRQRRQRHRFVDAVEAVDRLARRPPARRRFRRTDCSGR